MTEIKMTTPGEWIVAEITTDEEGEQIAVVNTDENGTIKKVIAIFGDYELEDETQAVINERLANAALLAVSKNMLDLLIDIQQKFFDPNINEIDISEYDRTISDILAKLANEAGEEL